MLIIRGMRQPLGSDDMRPRQTIPAVDMRRGKVLLLLRWMRLRLRGMSYFLARVLVLRPILHYYLVPCVALTSLFDQLVSGIYTNIHERFYNGVIRKKRWTATQSGRNRWTRSSSRGPPRGTSSRCSSSGCTASCSSTPSRPSSPATWWTGNGLAGDVLVQREVYVCHDIDFDSIRKIYERRKAL